MDFAVILVVAGTLLVAAEFCLPGWVLPGVAGGVAAIYGGYLLPVGSVAGLLASAAFAMLAGGRGWPRWTAALAGAAAVGAIATLDVHWLTALLGSVPALALYCLLTVASRALANKTFVG